MEMTSTPHVYEVRPRKDHRGVNLISDMLQIIEQNHALGGCRQLQARVRLRVAIAERKKSLAAMLANVAELGASRMEETIGKASLRDAAIGTGIAVDKMLALTGQTPAVQIANIVMPSEEERAERRAIDAKLDEITRRLAAARLQDGRQ